MRLFVVGLTGGIGSGKSTVAERFAALGAALVDTDAIAHELTATGGAAIEPIRAAFGAGVISLDGQLDRAVMRRLAFADTASRTKLEAILHPLIRAESEVRLCRLASADFSYAVFVVPLLIESEEYRKRVNRICVVDCPEEQQLSRVISRNGLARSDVEAIMAAQIARKDRLAVADDVIDNSGELDCLFRQVDRLHTKYSEQAFALGKP
jgi:dephospho-CoA kinase